MWGQCGHNFGTCGVVEYWKVISVEFHFIDKEFRLHRWTPICQKFEGRHTGDNIQAKLDLFMEVMSIDPRVHKTCVSDNAENMLPGVRLSDLNSYGCNNH